jgi:hypothetical protein
MLPSKDDVLSLDFAWRGQPFADIEAKTAGTLSLDFTLRGQPFASANNSSFVPSLAINANALFGAGSL